MGLWFGCWWIGRTPLTAEPAARAFAWVGGTLSAAAVGLFAFLVLMQPVEHPLAAVLARGRGQGPQRRQDRDGRFLGQLVPHVQGEPEVRHRHGGRGRQVEENQVVPMLADWTDKSHVIKKALNDLGSNSIPLLAIYPAGGSDKDVIILRDLLTQGDVLDALEKAGASKAKGASSNPPR